MPTVNIFYNNQEHLQAARAKTNGIKSFIAKELTCGDIVLTPEEISIRLINVTNTDMISELEVEVTAHAFDERIQRQDEICNSIRKYLLSNIEVKDARVWLLLPQLGHSWD